MKRAEALQVGVALVLVLATSLACKRKKEDSSSTSTASTTVETATAEPSTTAADTATTATPTTATTAATVHATSTAAVPAKSTYKVGENVTVMWQGQPYAASILAVLPNDKYKIHYTGWGSNWDETVGLDRIVGAKTGVAATATAKATGGGGGGTKPSSADAPCPGPGITRRCSGVCVNLQTDDNNCGDCGHKCPSGKHCDGHLFCRDAEGNL